MAEMPIVVFLGPSMPLSEAKRILDADYRPPVKRGDLAEVAPGTIVAIIDGVFGQDLSVSPREVREAIARGVLVYGGSSMGALRAAEVPGMVGVGRVFEWYRSRVITRDDEVALLFEPGSGRPMTVPTVNVRFAVERLCSLGTLDVTLGRTLITAASTIPFQERTYPTILKAAGVAGRIDSQDLIAMMQAHDVKYQDAQAVLEAVDRHVRRPRKAGDRTAVADGASVGQRNGHTVGPRRPTCMLVWESGDRVTYDELFQFLGFTGRLERCVRELLVGREIEAAGVDIAGAREAAAAGAQDIFDAAARRWGWNSSEEAKITLADLGLDVEWLGEECAREARAAELAVTLARKKSAALRPALLARLFLDDLALKRETMRVGALRTFAGRAEGPAEPHEVREAQRVLCKVNGRYDFASTSERWARLGLSDEAARDAFVDQLARARRSARELALAMTGRRPVDPSTAENLRGFGLGRRLKPRGEARFCLPVEAAERHARRIGEIIGVTRVGMIGELADLGGIQIAQAARPGNAWSSSYGSGKSRTEEGAVVGSIMEETEKWAQEQFRLDETISGSYGGLRDRGRFLDPATLDLPYDSVYREGMPLHWYRGFDLLDGLELYLPADPLQIGRRHHDIYFTQRGARKHLATNGLGAGFSREEAILHGICEYVERHAQRIAELFLANPGGIGDHPYRFVDLSTASPAASDLAERLGRDGATVRVLDITSDIRIPTFVACVTRALQKADGYGTHPDPNTAIEMALLEAAQTIASATAGGREDLTIRARSLGRHERPRPVSVRDAWFWMDPDPVYAPVSEVDGLSTSDIFEEIVWCLDRIRQGGVEHVAVVDLTPPAIEPAHVVRVIIPGLETNNPFYTGPRARLVLLRDLLPKWR